MILDYLIPVALAATDKASEQVRAGLSDKIADMFDFIITQIPSWIAAVLVFVATLFIAKIARNAVENRISDQVDEEHQEVLVLSGRLTSVGVITIGTTVALKIAGIDLTTILAAIAFGVGFALRDFLANFLAGIYILTSKQFSIGDFIKIGPVTGRVMEIQSRATILKTYDGYKVVVPNADIFTKQVTSLTTNPVRRVCIPLYISYDTDINYAMTIAKNIIKKNPKVLKKPGPSVIVGAYGDSSIDLMARFWVESRGGWFKVKTDLTKKLWEGFMKAGVTVPYNIMHLETSQDTVNEWKQNEEIVNRTKAKWKAAKEKRLAVQNPTQLVQNPTVVAPTPVAQNEDGTLVQNTPVGIAPVVNSQVPAPVDIPVAQTVPTAPPAQHQDMEEMNQNG